MSLNILNVPKQAIRIKGSKSAKIKTRGNVKEAISTGFIISATGSKFKPIIIGKGKTKRCLEKYNLDSTAIGTFSESRWINEDIMILILDQISERTGNEKSVLLLDQYDAHKTEKVRDYAKLKNITLVYVPTGLTNKYQPLDVAINGMLKTKMRKSYAQFVENNENDKYTCTKCISDLILNLKSISKKTVINSFDCLK